MSKKNIVENVPRYYETYVNDCFATAYGAVLAHKGFNPNIILADYLSFMFDPKTEYYGTTYLYRFSTSVAFTEAELNTSLEFAYFAPTTYFSECENVGEVTKHKDRVHITMYIDDDPEVAARRVEELVDSQVPVAAVVDLYYMSYHRAYQNEHGLHAIVLTGYDNENQEYHLFDKYLLSSSDFDGVLPMQAIRDGRISDVPRNNPIIGEYRRPIRHLWMEFNADPSFEVTDEKVFALLRESYLRMSGQKGVFDYVTGIQAIEELRKSVLGYKEKPGDQAAAAYFKEYHNTCLKRVARSRQRFAVFIREVADRLPQECVDILLENVQESAKRWDIISNISLKFAITKAHRMLDDMERNIQAIIEAESKVIEQLELCTKTTV
ncbi:BtrH N-terminal domain-containing protein [Paenibacillus athensensis]|uniref:Butirosin biosynthesis protein H N-terminal domain-containing protein n=1 Tax=Paenibacillus athensensis TaxID=1967502 RepID=A0A4Y8Q2A7_9BACL|nr:BtrH N-terminal domain-containing protein [Paenibacillus athensensis]MCD1258648.1 BtrH N-terminal domain-containing protein [Paenibacillus athensensis]